MLPSCADNARSRAISIISGSGSMASTWPWGTARAAVTAARAVPHGHVLAIDPDPEMIEIARERALSAQLGNITFHVRRAEELNLPARSIDAVLSRWSLMFVDDLGATLSMLHRLLRP